MLDSEAFDVVLKALIVLATLVAWMSPITWLSLALSDVHMKVAVVALVMCLAVFDPVLALITMAFFITILIQAPAPKRAQQGAEPDMAAAAKAAAYVAAAVAESSSEPRQNVKAPVDPSNGIAGRVLGSHPEKPPLGWSDDAIAPPTGEELVAVLAAHDDAKSSTVDADIQILCGVPNERLKDIQDDTVPGAQYPNGADEDTGMALVGADTMLLPPKAKA